MADRINVTGLDKENPEFVDGKEYPVDTTNEYILMTGQNMPNHTTSMRGRGKFVKVGNANVPTFRTKQEAYRFAVYLLTMVDIADLPDEEGAHTYAQVEDAIHNV